MSKFVWGLVAYLPVFGTWLALELIAVFWNRCPWPTLTGEVRQAIKDWPPLAYFLAVAAIALVGHFDLHWSVKWLLAVTFLAAAAATAHVVTR